MTFAFDHITADASSISVGVSVKLLTKRTGRFVRAGVRHITITTLFSAVRCYNRDSLEPLLMCRRSPFFLAACLALLPLLRGDTGPKRNITERDLFEFQWIGDPTLSPDGSRIAFVKVVVDKKRVGYETSIWTLSAGGDGATPVQLTNGPHDSSPRWAPDGKSLVFIRAVETGGKSVNQIELLSFAGGEPRAITSLPGGASAPSFSPDGKHLLLLSDTSPADLEKTEGVKSDEHHSDVRVITRAMYRFNGAGYLDFKHPTHIWEMAVPSPGADTIPPKQLTSGRFNESDPVWAPDGKVIYYLTVRKDEPYYEPPRTSSIGSMWRVDRPKR